MTIRHVLAAVVFGLATRPSWAQTTVVSPWVRGSVPLQKATGRFAQIISVAGGKLVSVPSPVANAAESDEMSMVDGVMLMRALVGLDLPGGH